MTTKSTSMKIIKVTSLIAGVALLIYFSVFSYNYLTSNKYKVKQLGGKIFKVESVYNESTPFIIKSSAFKVLANGELSASIKLYGKEEGEKISFDQNIASITFKFCDEDNFTLLTLSVSDFTNYQFDESDENLQILSEGIVSLNTTQKESIALAKSVKIANYKGFERTKPKPPGSVYTEEDYEEARRRIYGR